MTGHDDEFEDFLRRRRPMFGRPDDQLEPPAELDRIVLRRARDAIEEERPQRIFRAPSWGMPVALAATLVLAFTIILRVGTNEVAKQPQVTVQNVSRQIEMPAAAAAPAPAPAPAPEAMRSDAATELTAPSEPSADASGAMIVDIGARSDKAAADANEPGVAEQRGRRLEKVADTARAARESASHDAAARFSQPMGATTSTAAEPAMASAAVAPKPAYRLDEKSWLAEIERLRAAGDTARADAELAEYKREHRAYAGAPDR
jgi:hypothetical protein